MKKIFLLLMIVLSFSSCEKDDICDENTSTTPRLIIDFYDVTIPTDLKKVTNLAIIGEGVTDTIKFNNVSKIQVPLKISADIIKYRFILNYSNKEVPTLKNEDLLEFRYSKNIIYVSRACGYKNTFALDKTTPFIKTDAPTPDLFWIKSITLLKRNIDTENETHLKITF